VGGNHHINRALVTLCTDVACTSGYEDEKQQQEVSNHQRKFQRYVKEKENNKEMMV